MTKSTWNTSEQSYTGWLLTLPPTATVTFCQARTPAGVVPVSASAEWDDPDWATCRAVMDDEGYVMQGPFGDDPETVQIVAAASKTIRPLLDGDGRTILTDKEIDAVYLALGAKGWIAAAEGAREILRELHGWPRP